MQPQKNERQKKRAEQNKANGQKALFFGTMKLSKNIIFGFMLLQIAFLGVFELGGVNKRQCRMIIFYIVAYLSSYHEKTINALYKLAYELPTICLPHQHGGLR